jgi:hypothetical protein
MSDQDLLSDLHYQKQEAIDALDFEKAHSLYDEIQNQIANQARRSISNIRRFSCRALKKAQSDFRQLLEQLAERKRTLDARLYSQFDVIFEQTRADHINQIIDLEKERGLTLLSESEREVEEQIALLERGKQAAIDSHFDLAIDLRQQARDVGQAELNRRRQSVEDYFAQAKAELLAQQQSELDEIAAMHQTRLDRERKDAQDREAKATDDFRIAVTQIRNETKVQIRALRAEDDLKDDAVTEALAELGDLMAEFDALPPVAPHLTESEEMRVTQLCPTNAVKNAMPTEIPMAILQKARVSPSTTRTPRATIKPFPMSSTRLLTRVYTGVCRPRASFHPNYSRR